MNNADKLTPGARLFHGDVWRQASKQLRVGAVDLRVQHKLGKDAHANSLDAAVTINCTVEVRVQVSRVGSLA